MADEQQVIDAFRGDYRFLSNFYIAPVRLTLLGRSREFRTVEHAFQGAKILVSGWAPENQERWLQEMLELTDPQGAKKMGRMVPIDIERWNRLSGPVMLKALRLKFALPDLRRMLLATDDALLIEGNRWGDMEWGQVNGKGKNRLGKMLMQVRTEIRESSPE